MQSIDMLLNNSYELKLCVGIVVLRKQPVSISVWNLGQLVKKLRICNLFVRVNPLM